MIPSLLITLREVIEASLVVATILGILSKLGKQKHIKTVWIATISALVVSVGLLGIASLIGIKIQTIYQGRTEEFLEGSLMILSAIFITWAVFFLHTYFGKYKTRLLVTLTNTVEKNEHRGIFILTFAAVFREGFEIILFLSTIYFSSNPMAILSGFSIGALLGLMVSFALFNATIKMPVYWAFRVTSALLILFAAGLLGRGIHEFTEVGLLPEMTKVTLAFLPTANTFAADVVTSIFGITRYMDYLQLSVYLTYIYIMHRRVFVRSR